MTTPFNFYGAEAGNFIEVESGSGTVEVTTVNPRTGTYAYRFYPSGTGTGSAGIRTRDVSGQAANFDVAILGFRGWLRINTGGAPAANYEPIAAVLDQGGSNRYTLNLTSSRTLEIRWDTTFYAAGTAVIPVGEYHLIEWLINCNTNEVIVSVDGTQDISTTIAASATTISATIGKHANVNGQSIDIQWDDVALASGGLPDAGVVRMALPMAAGSAAGWTSGTGVTFAEVNEVPHNSDSTYISASNTEDNTDHTFNVQNASTIGVTGVVRAVKPLAVMRSASTGGSSAVGLRYLVNSSAFELTHLEIPPSYWPYFVVLLTDPSDSQAWTNADFDTIEVGVSANTIGQIQYCTCAYVFVWDAALPSVTLDVSTAGALAALAAQDVASAAATSILAIIDALSAAALSLIAQIDVTTVAATILVGETNVASEAAISTLAQADMTSEAAIAMLVQADVASEAAISATAAIEVASVASLEVSTTSQTNVVTAAAITVLVAQAVTSEAAISLGAQIDVTSTGHVSLSFGESVLTTASVSTSVLIEVSTTASLSLGAVQSVQSVAALQVGASVNVTSAAAITVEVAQSASVFTQAAIAIVTGISVSTQASVSLMAQQGVASAASVVIYIGADVATTAAIELGAVVNVATQGALTRIEVASVTAQGSIVLGASLDVLTSSSIAQTESVSVASQASVSIINVVPTINVLTSASIYVVASVDVLSRASLMTYGYEEYVRAVAHRDMMRAREAYKRSQEAALTGDTARAQQVKNAWAPLRRDHTPVGRDYWDD